MKILLINPSVYSIKQEGVQVVPPLGLLYIGAVLEQAGHAVRILDCVAHGWKRPKCIDYNGEERIFVGIEENEIEEILTQFRPDIVGISNLFSTSEKTCIELIAVIKNVLPESVVVLGGTNATSRFDFLLKNSRVDYVIRGEGEEAFSALVEATGDSSRVAAMNGIAYMDEAGIRDNGVTFVENLDGLPFPAYHLLQNPIEDYFGGRFGGFAVSKRILSVTTSRGCVLNCYFCTGKKNLGHWRGRRVDNVLSEIRYLRKTFGVEEIAFVDANINFDPVRYEGLLDGLAVEVKPFYWSPFGGIYVRSFEAHFLSKMKKSGCHSVCIAVEHGDPQMQKMIGKIVPLEKVQTITREAKRVGIWTHGYFVVGLPGETASTLEATFDYARESMFDSVSFFVGTPLPGSRFYEDITGLSELNSDDLRFGTSNITWSHMSGDQINKTVKRFILQFSKIKLRRELSPANILTRLLSIDRANIKLYLRIVKRVFANLYYR